MDVDNERPEQDIDMEAEGAIADDDDMMVEEHATETDEMYIEEDTHGEHADDMEAEPTPPVEGHERGFSFTQSTPAAAPALVDQGPLSIPAIGTESPFIAGSVQPPSLEPQGAVAGVEDESEGVVISEEEAVTGEEIIAPEIHADLSAIQEGDQDIEQHTEEYENEHGDEQGDGDEQFDHEHSNEHEESYGDAEAPIAEDADGHEEEYDEGGDEEFTEGEEGEEGEEACIDGDQEGEEHNEQPNTTEGATVTGEQEVGQAEGANAIAGSSKQAIVTAEANDIPHLSTSDPPADSGNVALADRSETILDTAEEDEYDEVVYEDGDDDMDDYPTDIHSLPSIIINLPSLGARALFGPLPGDQSLPVWLPDKVEALGEASLAKMWTAIKAELRKENLVQAGEMIVTEKQMELKMGEDDVNLQSITLLELAQVHYGCGLPAPIQLYISFEPHRFITRFNAIQQEVQAQMKALADEAVELEVEVAGEIHEGEDAEGGYFEGDDGDQEGEGEAETWEEAKEDDEDKQNDEASAATRAAEDSQEERERRREEYLRQKRERAEHAEDGSRREKHRRVESEHPNADWAHARRESLSDSYRLAQLSPVIEPPKISGSRIFAPPRSPQPRADESTDTQVDETEAEAVEVISVTVPPPAPAPREVADVQDERKDDDVVVRAGGDKRADEDNDTNEDTETEMSTTAEKGGPHAYSTAEVERVTVRTGDLDDDEDEGIDVSFDPDAKSVDIGEREPPLDEIALMKDKQEFARKHADTVASPLATPSVSEMETSRVEPLDSPAISVATTSVIDADGFSRLGRSDNATPEERSRLTAVVEENLSDIQAGADTAVEADLDDVAAKIQNAADLVDAAADADLGPAGRSAVDQAEFQVAEAKRLLEEAEDEAIDPHGEVVNDEVTYDEDDEDTGSDEFDRFADDAIELVERGDEGDDALDDAAAAASPAITLEGDTDPEPVASDQVVGSSALDETPLSVTETDEPIASVSLDDDGLNDGDGDTSLGLTSDTASKNYLSSAEKRKLEYLQDREADGEDMSERDEQLEQLDAYDDDTVTKKSRTSQCGSA